MGKTCPKCKSEQVETLDYGARTGAGVFAGVGAFSAGSVAYTSAKLAEEATKLAEEAAKQVGRKVVTKSVEVLPAVAKTAAQASPIAFGIAGTVLSAAALGGFALGVSGHKLGSFFDSHVLKNYRCLACNHKFNGK